MTLPRRRRWTLIFMTVLVVGFALMTALYIGYLGGQRTSARPSNWKKRTNRMTIGMLAVNLMTLVVARRIQRSLFAQRPLPAFVGAWGLKPMTRRPPMRPQLLRGNAPRRRRKR